MSKSETLKDVLKPPFCYKKSRGSLGAIIMDSEGKELFIAFNKITYFENTLCDWVCKAINEKWERDYGRQEYLDKVAKSDSLEADKYISDPNTRVFINHNNDAGPWRYSVEVSGEGFWLDSFKTEKEARDYIKKHNLKHNFITEVKDGSGN